MPSGRADPRGGSADEAAKIVMWGGLIGAMRWSVYTTIAGVFAYMYSPVFRGLTPQFKVYLFMCPVTVGGMTEADRRLRQYEARVRMERRALAMASYYNDVDDVADAHSGGGYVNGIKVKPEEEGSEKRR